MKMGVTSIMKRLLLKLIFGMIVGFIGYNGIPKVAENQTIDKDGYIVNKKIIRITDNIVVKEFNFDTFVK